MEWGSSDVTIVHSLGGMLAWVMPNLAMAFCVMHVPTGWVKNRIKIPSNLLR